MKKFIFIIIYLVLGILWTISSGGMLSSKLHHYDGDRLYPNIITEVKSSFITEEGLLNICINGRLGHSEKHPVDITSFSIIIPIKEIWKHKKFNKNGTSVVNETSYILEISDNAIKDICIEPNEKSINVPILNSGLTAKQAVRFMRNYNDPLKLNFEEMKAIYVIPTAYEYMGFHYREPVRIYYINKEKDVVGRKFYEIELNDSWKQRNISFIEYAWAFTLDTVTFPYQLYRLVSW